MKVLYGIAVALLVLAAAAVAYAVSPRAIEAVKRPDPQSFDRATVAHGERLALIGNCAECHTAEQGEAYAGGRAIPTPLGTIYATNITPDLETGIGTWSREAFRRSMYEGLDREGEHLYPAFPYHHFTKVLPEDIDALYAYLMTREPVRNEAPANELRFPFNLRPLLAGWKLLYLDNGRFAGLADADEKVNRGAYLVPGAGTLRRLPHTSQCSPGRKKGRVPSGRGHRKLVRSRDFWRCPGGGEMERKSTRRLSDWPMGRAARCRPRRHGAGRP